MHSTQYFLIRKWYKNGTFLLTKNPRIFTSDKRLVVVWWDSNVTVTSVLLILDTFLIFIKFIDLQCYLIAFFVSREMISILSKKGYLCHVSRCLLKSLRCLQAFSQHVERVINTRLDQKDISNFIS